MRLRSPPSRTTGHAGFAVGGFNIAEGFLAGLHLTTGSHNIDIGDAGVASDSGTIRTMTPSAGTDSDDFKSHSSCPSSLAVGTGCEIIVELFADNLGSRSATLNLYSNATGSPQTVPLSATVIKH